MDQDRSYPLQSKLKLLHELNVGLTQAPMLKDLCRDAVLLGREHLGFDRLALVLWDEERRTCRGTFGIDRNGNLIDQSNIYRSIESVPQLYAAVGQNSQLAYWDSIVLFENAEPVGEGPCVVATLSNGQKNLGWLVADNLIHQAPLDMALVELLALYGNSLGHIIARKQAEESRTYSQQRLLEMVERSPVAIIEYDLEHRLRSWNPAAEQIFGYRQDEVVGKFAMDYIVPEDVRDQVNQKLKSVFASEDVHYSINENVTKDGQRILCEWYDYPIYNGDGRLIGFASMAQDISLREQAEQQRMALQIERQKLDFLQTFMDNITHDLKTPLAAIKTGLYLLSRYKEEAKQQEKMAQVLEQTNRLETLVQNLLTLSRLDYMTATQREWVDINHLIRSILEGLHPLIERKNLRVVQKLDVALSHVHADGEAIQSAISNLIVNAVNYTPTDRRILIETFVEDGYATIRVEDQGIGIAPEELQHIFDRHFRSVQARSMTGSGSGLGLSIVKQAVELHGGQIKVESKLGEGTAFRLRLPLSQNPAQVRSNH